MNIKEKITLICKQCQTEFKVQPHKGKTQYCSMKCYSKSKLPNIIGNKYGFLTVLSFERRDRAHTYWKCACVCGNIRVNTKNTLMRGTSTSCGCKNTEKLIKRNTKHNLSNSKIYKVWHGIMQRCYNPKCREYRNYGARGIIVEKSWHKFDIFYEQFGENRKEGLQIDRINNDGEYSLNNCRWATHKENNNNKRTNVRMTNKGITKTLAQWAEIYKIKKNTVYSRYKTGKSFNEIFDNKRIRGEYATTRGSKENRLGTTV